MIRRVGQGHEPPDRLLRRCSIAASVADFDEPMNILNPVSDCSPLESPSGGNSSALRGQGGEHHARLARAQGGRACSPMMRIDPSLAYLVGFRSRANRWASAI
jgi:hypothetical protein